MTQDSSKTGSRLVAGLQSGADWAWVEFFKLYHPRLLGWARKSGLNHADADEVVAELIAKLNVRLSSFQYDRTKTFKGYMRTMLQNLVSDSRRKKRRLGQVFTLEEGHDRIRTSASESVLDEICKVEAEALLIISQKEVLDRIPEDNRVIWIALAIKSATVDELAAELATSRSSVYRIRTQVSKEIRKRFMEISGDGT